MDGPYVQIGMVEHSLTYSRSSGVTGGEALIASKTIEHTGQGGCKQFVAACQHTSPGFQPTAHGTSSKADSVPCMCSYSGAAQPVDGTAGGLPSAAPGCQSRAALLDAVLFNNSVNLQPLEENGDHFLSYVFQKVCVLQLLIWCTCFELCVLLVLLAIGACCYGWHG